MPTLSDNEARSLICFAIGVSSEGLDKACQLSFAGNILHDAQIFGSRGQHDEEGTE